MFEIFNLFATDLQSLPRAPIHIPMRGSQDDKDAKGTFFDHYVFQRATDHPTLMVIPDEQLYPKGLKDYVVSLTYRIKYGAACGSHILPQQAMPDSLAGLLIIPGRERDKEYNIVREQHEKALLRKALLRGQPILGICAGAWRVWEALYQLENDSSFTGNIPETLVDVTDHVNSRMMSLSDNGQVGYNSQIHGVTIQKNTMLYGMMTNNKNPDAGSLKLNVNSVHWKAPKESCKPENVCVVGKSTEGNVKARNNRHGNLMKPQSDIIEAFETGFGAPVIGIQWHPEAYNTTAYNDDDQDREYHLRILRRMAKAGDVYAQKQKVLEELRKNYKKYPDIQAFEELKKFFTDNTFQF